MKPTPGPTISVNVANFRLARGAAGLTTDTELAERMGVHATSVYRTLRGDTRPGGAFIAGALLAFPALKFDDLFLIDREPDDEAVPA